MLRAKVGAQIPLTERQGRNRDRVVGTAKSARTFNSSRPQQWSLHTEPLNHAVSRRLADSNRWKASEHKEHVNAPRHGAA